MPSNQDRNYDKPTGTGSRETLKQGGDLGQRPSRDLGNRQNGDLGSQQSGDLGNLQSGGPEQLRGSNRDRARSERQLSEDDIGTAGPSER